MTEFLKTLYELNPEVFQIEYMGLLGEWHDLPEYQCLWAVGVKYRLAPKLPELLSGRVLPNNAYTYDRDKLGCVWVSENERLRGVGENQHVKGIALAGDSWVYHEDWTPASGVFNFRDAGFMVSLNDPNSDQIVREYYAWFIHPKESNQTIQDAFMVSDAKEMQHPMSRTQRMQGVIEQLRESREYVEVAVPVKAYQYPTVVATLYNQPTTAHFFIKTEAFSNSNRHLLLMSDYAFTWILDSKEWKCEKDRSGLFR